MESGAPHIEKQLNIPDDFDDSETAITTKAFSVTLKSTKYVQT